MIRSAAAGAFARPLNIAYNAGGPGGICRLARKPKPRMRSGRVLKNLTSVNRVSRVSATEGLAATLRCAAEEWPVFAWERRSYVLMDGAVDLAEARGWLVPALLTAA